MRSTVTRTALLCFVTVLVALFFGIVIGGCAMKVSQSPGTEGATALDADTLYARAEHYYERGAYRLADAAARELLERAPDYSRADEAYLLAAKASSAAGEFPQTVKYGRSMIQHHELSPYREPVLLLAAEASEHLERYYDAADFYLRVLAAPTDESVRERARTAVGRLSQEHLTPSDLDRLVAAYPASPLASEMSLGLAKKEFARGNYDRAYELLTELLYEFPEHKGAREVRQLLQLASARRADPGRKTEHAEPYRIGLVLPQTGSYARFGRYFEEGAAIAVQDFRSSHDLPVTVVTADTKGDPIEAAKAVRRLIQEEGVAVVMGGVLAVPTIAAAIESNASRVPILSPVVADPGLEGLGPWVFQTKVGREIEVVAIATLASQSLLLERFAVLAPDTPEGNRVAALFAEQVTNRGREVVAQERYQKGDTDFRDQLEVIRSAAPDALFIPGATEELIQLLPQVAFYDMQVQLLGLSEWNSEQLLRLSQRELEGALFPSEAHYGRSPGERIAFEQRYQEAHRSEPHVVAEAAYFGTRLLLQAMVGGAIDRGQLRDALESAMRDTADPASLAATLPVLRVRSGRVTRFTIGQ